MTEGIIPGQVDEKMLLAGCRQGNQAAYKAVVNHYAPMLWRIAYRMTGSRIDAEDLSQEAFIKAFDSLWRFRGDAKLSTYLCSIVVNLSLNLIKRKGRREEFPIEKDSAIFAYPEISPRAAAENKELNSILEKGLASLQPQLRAAIVLTAIEGMTHSDAAKALGCAEKTVSWRIHEARKYLRQCLKLSNK